MSKKSWKQRITAILVCALIISTTCTNTAFASASRNITAGNISKKAATNGSEKDSTRKSTNEEENSPEYNKILTECKEIKTGETSTELRRGEMVSIESISGENTKMAIMSNGDLYCWGANTYGQVGNGSTTNKLTPYKVLSKVKYVTSSSSSSSLPVTMVAITEDGDLYCWGFNGFGQIGNGLTTLQLTPYKVLSKVKFVTYNPIDFACTVAAILENGDLYCWGGNTYGQAGNGSTTNQLTPYKVLSSVKSVTYSFGSMAAITENGDLYCWGYNGFGQVGNGSTNNQLIPYKVLSGVKFVIYSSPHESSSFSTSDTVAAIMENGDLYCWGDNGFGQVGNGSTTNQRTPYKVLDRVKFISYSNSSQHLSDLVAAITEDGDLYCWGYNGTGQIGNGLMSPTNQCTPYKVLSRVKYVTYSSEGLTAAITEDGDLYCWGNNLNGQAGKGSIGDQLTPYKVLSRVKSVTYSYLSVAAITEDGDLYCWGNNLNGQAGNGSTTNQLTPYKVLSGVKSVTYSYFSVAAITENGDLYCWGANAYGQVGNGSTTDQLTPCKVLSKVKSITYSSNSVLDSVAAITENGDLYCWGYNVNGQVGNGSTTNQRTPYKVFSGTLPGGNTTSPSTVPPTETPSTSPSVIPPTETPSTSPSVIPPTGMPSTSPSVIPPTETPSTSPSVVPPTEIPSASPSVVPPTAIPSVSPSAITATETPSNTPSAAPIVTSSSLPSNSPKPSGSSSGAITTGSGGSYGGGGGFIGGGVSSSVTSTSPTPAPVTSVTPPSVTPAVTVVPTAAALPKVTSTPVVITETTKEPITTPAPAPSASPVAEKDSNSTSSTELKKGLKVTDKKTKAVYKIKSLGKNKEAEYIKSTNKNPASVVIPDSVKIKGKTFKVVSIGKAAFKNNKKLKSVKIGKNIETIGKEAFSGCKKLAEVKMGRNITSIKASAFNKCISLAIITIPSKVKKIGKKAFYKCKNLQYIDIKTTRLKKDDIGKDAFSSGYSNPRVKIDKSVFKQYQKIFASKGLLDNTVFITRR